MGINIKKLAKQNRVKNASELQRKIRYNQIVHALYSSVLHGDVRKVAKKDAKGNVIWYWGLSEWMDEDGNIIEKYRPIKTEKP